MNQPIPYEEQLARMAGFGSAAERQIYDNQQAQYAHLRALGYNVSSTGVVSTPTITPIIPTPQPVVIPVPDITPVQPPQISQQTVPRTTSTSSSPGINLSSLKLPNLSNISPVFLVAGAALLILILK